MPRPARESGPARRIVVAAACVLACTASDRPPPPPDDGARAAASQALASDLAASAEYPVDDPVPVPSAPGAAPPRVAFAGSIGLVAWQDAAQGDVRAQRLDAGGHPIGDVYQLGMGKFDVAASAGAFAIAIQRGLTQVEVVRIRASDGFQYPSTVASNHNFFPVHVASDGTDFLVGTSTTITTTGDPDRAVLGRVPGDGSGTTFTFTILAGGEEVLLAGSPSGYVALVLETSFEQNSLFTIAPDGTVRAGPVMGALFCGGPATVFSDGTTDAFGCQASNHAWLLFVDHASGAATGLQTLTLVAPGTPLAGFSLFGSGGHFAVIWSQSTGGVTGADLQFLRVARDGTLEDRAPVTWLARPEDQEALAVTSLGGGPYVVTADRGPGGRHLVGTLFTTAPFPPPVADTVDLATGWNHAQAPAAAVAGDTLLVAWEDDRFAQVSQKDVYARRFSVTTGRPLDARPFVVAGGAAMQASPRVASDGRDFRVAWLDGAVVATAAVLADGTVGPVQTTVPSGLGGSATDPAIGFGGGSYFLAYVKSTNAAGTYSVVRVLPDGTLGAPRDATGVNALRGGVLVGTSSGAVFAFRDVPASGAAELFATRISPAGDLLDQPPFPLHSDAVGTALQPAGVRAGADALLGWTGTAASALVRVRFSDGTRTTPVVLPTGVAANTVTKGVPPRFVDDGFQLLFVAPQDRGDPAFDLRAYGASATPAADGTSQLVWATLKAGGTDVVGVGGGRSIVLASQPGAFGDHVTFRGIGPPAPAATRFSDAAREGTTTFIAVPGAGGGVEVELVTPPTHGTATAVAGGLTYRGDDGVVTPDHLTYRLRRWLLTSDPARLDLVVGDRRPTLSVGGDLTLAEDAPGGASTPVTGAAAPGRTLSYRVVAPPGHGTVTIDGDAATYVPAPDFAGTDAFTFLADDGAQQTDPVTVAVTVTPVNDPPVLAPCDGVLDEDGRLALELSAHDVDDEAFTWDLREAPAHGRLTGTAPHLTYVPDADCGGSDAVTFRVSDASSSSPDVTCRLTVRPVNDPPVVTAPPLATLQEVAVSATLTAADAEHDEVTWTLVMPPAHGALSGTLPALTYAPAFGFSGADAFTVRASDGTAAVDVEIGVSVVHVNHAPTCSDTALSTPEDTMLVATLEASDRDGDALTWSLAARPASGTAVLGADGLLRYTPPRDWSGHTTLDVSVADPAGLAAAATVAIDVLPVNDPPTARALTVDTDEDTPVPVVFQGSDADGDAIAYALDIPPFHGRVVTGPSGRLYVPAADYTGLDRFTYRATDGTDVSAPAEVTVRIRPVNDAPVAAGATRTGPEDAPLPVTLAADDVEGDPLTYAIARAPAHGTLTGAPPTLTYVPADDFFGDDDFTFTASDGELTSAPATVRLTIMPVPDAPVVAPQHAEGTEDVPLALVLAGSDADGDGLTWEIVTPPGFGVLEGVPPALVYVPPPDFSGSDRFTYRVSDGLLTSPEVAVELAIAPVNDVPLAHPLTASTPRRTRLEFDLPATDADGDALGFAIVEQVRHGTLTAVSGARFTYDPDPAFHGTDRFTFAASDAETTSAPAEVLVNVGLDNKAPVAVAATVTIAEDVPVDLTLAGRDAEADPLEIHVVVAPQHGALEGRRYVPAADFHGEDTVGFTVDDGLATSAPATITIVVAPVNDAPTTQDAAASSAGEPVTVTLAGSDVDGDALTWAVAEAPAHGTATMDGARLTYTPRPSFSGMEAIGFTVRDPAGATARGTLRVTVTAAPDSTPDAGSSPANPPTGCGCGALPAGWTALAVVFLRRRRRA